MSHLSVESLLAHFQGHPSVRTKKAHSCGYFIRQQQHCFAKSKEVIGVVETSRIPCLIQISLIPAVSPLCLIAVFEPHPVDFLAPPQTHRRNFRGERRISCSEFTNVGALSFCIHCVIIINLLRTFVGNRRHNYQNCLNPNTPRRALSFWNTTQWREALGKQRMRGLFQ